MEFTNYKLPIKLRILFFGISNFLMLLWLLLLLLLLVFVSSLFFSYYVFLVVVVLLVVLVVVLVVLVVVVVVVVGVRIGESPNSMQSQEPPTPESPSPPYSLFSEPAGLLPREEHSEPKRNVPLRTRRSLDRP